LRRFDFMPGLLLLQTLSLQPRFAFLLLAGLIVGAAVPLAIGWARLLPEEKPPFEIENPRRRSAAPSVSIYGSEPAPRKIDFVALALLFLLTVSFALQFPGVPREPALNSLPDHWPGAGNWYEIALPCLLTLVCAAAIVHGAVRRSFLKMPLLVGGGLVLLLWLAAPWLYWTLLAG
jgi:hypothetical protein